MTTTKTMTDAQGQQVPLAYVKPYDRERDRLARRNKARWEKARAVIERVYQETAADLESIEALAADGRQDRALGKKGNFQFTSFDGLIQISRSARYELRFDERLRTAQEIIEGIKKHGAQPRPTNVRDMKSLDMWSTGAALRCLAPLSYNPLIATRCGRSIPRGGTTPALLPPPPLRLVRPLGTAV